MFTAFPEVPFIASDAADPDPSELLLPQAASATEAANNKTHAI
jgi:hypothetical protein